MNSEQLKELKVRVEALKEYLEYDKKKSFIEEEEKQTTEPGFWDDPKAAEKILKKIKSVRIWTNDFDKVSASFGDVETLFEFFQEGDVEESEVDTENNNCIKLVEDLEFKMMLSNEEDQFNAILQINPGAGGTRQYRPHDHRAMMDTSSLVCYRSCTA